MIFILCRQESTGLGKTAWRVFGSDGRAPFRILCRLGRLHPLECGIPAPDVVHDDPGCTGGRDKRSLTPKAPFHILEPRRTKVFYKRKRPLLPADKFKSATVFSMTVKIHEHRSKRHHQVRCSRRGRSRPSWIRIGFSNGNPGPGPLPVPQQEACGTPPCAAGHGLFHRCPPSGYERLRFGPAGRSG